MKAIIQERIFLRGERVFSKSNVRWVLSPGRDEAKLLALQAEHNAKAIVIDSRPFSKAFFQSLPKHSLIARFGTGTNNIPIEVCKQNNLSVANTPGAIKHSAAEFALGLILALVRRVAASHGDVLKGEWNRPEGVQLLGKTLGVVGFGAVGQALAKKARNGFGMDVVAYGRRPLGRFAEAREALSSGVIRSYSSPPDLSSFLGASDVVSLHVPFTPSTARLIDADALAAMKPSAFLINTSRGGVLDEAALHKALSSGRLGGAALDVFSREPYQPTSEQADLRRLKNVLMTPHLASHTDIANDLMAEQTVRNVEAFCRGQMEDVNLVEAFQNRSTSR